MFFGNDVRDIDTGILGKRVRADAKKVPGNAKKSARGAEKEIGIALSKSGIKVDFSSTETVTAYLAENKSYYGMLLCAIDRNKIQMHSPEKRPYNFSGTVNAELSKAFVNLARTTSGEIADPFCGSGAFLIEAGAMGLSVFGCDTSKKHFYGAMRNLRHFGIRKFDVRLMDALLIREVGRQFDGIVTDLPWGRNTRSRYYNKNELYRKFMKMLPEILKKGRYAVISCDMDELWHPQELRLEGKFELLLRKSLKRHVWVFKRI